MPSAKPAAAMIFAALGVFHMVILGLARSLVGLVSIQAVTVISSVVLIALDPSWLCSVFSAQLIHPPRGAVQPGPGLLVRPAGQRSRPSFTGTLIR